MIFHSLRWRLVLASIVIELILLGILIFNSYRILDSEFGKHVEQHVNEIGPLLSAAVAAPLVARDLATLDELLRESRSDGGIEYLLLVDSDGHVVASEGWEPGAPLPPQDADVHATVGETISRFDTAVSVMLNGRIYGTLHFGVSTEALKASESVLVRQSLIIAVVEVIFSVVALTLAGLWLTRHLRALTVAAENIQAGDFTQVVAVRSKDEVGKLAMAFNAMSQSVKRTVDERTAALEGAQAKLVRSQRLAAIGQLAGTVAHELRNPLGTITNAYAAIQKLAGSGDPKLERPLELMRRNIDRCVRIIDELLNYARPSQLLLSKTAVDEWLREVIGEYKIDESIALSLSLESSAAVPFDPARLRQAIINVMDNARQAMIEGGGDGHQLEITTRQVNDRLEISITDNGPGIEPDVFESIFEPLYSTRNFGVGFGLPLVRDVLREHKGDVEVHSRPGEGTRVTLWMPLGGDSDST